MNKKLAKLVDDYAAGDLSPDEYAEAVRKLWDQGLVTIQQISDATYKARERKTNKESE